MCFLLRNSRPDNCLRRFSCTGDCSSSGLSGSDWRTASWSDSSRLPSSWRERGRSTRGRRWCPRFVTPSPATRIPAATSACTSSRNLWTFPSTRSRTPPNSSSPGSSGTAPVSGGRAVPAVAAVAPSSYGTSSTFGSGPAGVASPCASAGPDCRTASTSSTPCPPPSPSAAPPAPTVSASGAAARSACACPLYWRPESSPGPDDVIALLTLRCRRPPPTHWIPSV